MKARVRVEAKRLPHNAGPDERHRNFENMLRIFRRAVNEYGVLTEAKRREYYEKPSEQRRRKRAERSWEIAKQQRKDRKER